MHGSRRAPRCLPCNYSDPLEASGVGARINGFQAVKACPCNLEALCKGPSNEHIINSWDCTWSRHHPGWWYFAHGWAAWCALLACLVHAQAREAGLEADVMAGCQTSNPAHMVCVRVQPELACSRSTRQHIAGTVCWSTSSNRLTAAPAKMSASCLWPAVLLCGQ